MPARRTSRSEESPISLNQLTHMIRRNPTGTPVLISSNRLSSGNRSGTRYRGNRMQQGPPPEVDGYDINPILVRRFNSIGTHPQRSTPVVLTNQNVTDPPNFLNQQRHHNMFRHLNAFLPIGQQLQPASSYRNVAPQHLSTLSINHILANHRGTIRRYAKNGQEMHLHDWSVEHLGRTYEDVAQEVTTLLTNLDRTPDEILRAEFLLNVLEYDDEERTDRLRDELDEVIFKKRRNDITKFIHRRPRTLRGRARSLGRKIKRGLQRRLGTRASRNSNVSNNE